MNRANFVRLFFVATLSLSPSLVSAQEHKIGVMGAGIASCGKWSTWRSGTDAAAHALSFGALSWVEGYITAEAGVSQRVNAALHNTDSEGIGGFIDKYCRAHPLASIGYAASALALELQNSN